MKDKNWQQFLEQEKQKDYFKNLEFELAKQLANGVEIFPLQENWFRALEECDFDELQVVIIGQDPYHTPKVANGLAFATNEKKLPPSLKNIFKELKDNYPEANVNSGDLIHWAKQGILLINRVLTVISHKPESHYNLGWEIFTKNLLDFVVKNKENVVFVLLGSKAQSIEKEIDLSKQHVIKTAHPSPLSAYRGFFGSKLFLKINSLVKNKIKW